MSAAERFVDFWFGRESRSAPRSREEELRQAAADALSWWENHGLFDPDDTTFTATLSALRSALAACPPPESSQG